MCNEAVRIIVRPQRCVKEPLINVHGYCDMFQTASVEVDPQQLKYVPDHLKTQEMCKKAAVSGFSYSLQYVPDRFVTQEQVKVWHDEDDDDDIVDWYNEYKKDKAQKTQIK